MRPRLRIAAFTLVAGLAGAGGYRAATPEAVETVAERLAAAGQALDAARTSGAAPEVVAEAISQYDRALSAMRTVVMQAGARENDVRLGLARDQLEISRLLAALERVSLERESPVDLHPGGPLAAARAQMMSKALEPALAEKAQGLSERLAAMRAARQVQEDGVADLEEGLGRLALARSELVAHMQFVQLGGTPVDAATAVALREANSLADLSRALDTNASPAPADDRPARPYLWPVDSDILRGFNETDAAGARWPGVVLSAPPLSLVRAPADATIRYAGPFIDYQGIVILETADKALVLLAGLAELNVRTGEQVTRGSPLGMLGGRSPDVEEYVMLRDLETGAGLREALYIEIRHGRGPVDPVSWFVATNG